MISKALFQCETRLLKQFSLRSIVKAYASTVCGKRKDNFSSKCPSSRHQRCICPLLSRHIYTSKQFQSTDKVLGQEIGDEKLIYFGEKGSVLKRVQFALYAVGAALIVPSPYLFTMLPDERAMQYTFIGWVFLFGVANPLLFYEFTKRYVFELYCNKKTGMYTAITPSRLIIKQRKVEFYPKDCKMPDSPAAFSSFLVKGKPLLVSSSNMDYFEYSKMLRYASELDYENPDRQSQYEETFQEAIKEIGSQKQQQKEQKPE